VAMEDDPSATLVRLQHLNSTLKFQVLETCAKLQESKVP